MTMTMVQAQALTLSHVHCRYGKDDVVRDISLTLSAGHIGCLLGPSGCGKPHYYAPLLAWNQLPKAKSTLATAY